MWWQGTPRAIRLAHKHLEVAAELPDTSPNRQVLIDAAERSLDEHLESRHSRQVLKDVLAMATLGAVTYILFTIADDQGGLWWATALLFGAVTIAAIAAGIWALRHHMKRNRR